jgi:hypothetical protein
MSGFYEFNIYTIMIMDECKIFIYTISEIKNLKIYLKF